MSNAVSYIYSSSLGHDQFTQGLHQEMDAISLDMRVPSGQNNFPYLSTLRAIILALMQADSWPEIALS